MWLSILLIVLGFILLIKGAADWMVEGASSLAKKNNVSDYIFYWVEPHSCSSPCLREQERSWSAGRQAYYCCFS